ncbi:MAG TPA: alkyl hydroperoxide reductase [Gemmatimonadaceae bacterium]|nr:alkyl hydroperoxide reductase [Gemmatimonadaceae bacterium]
MLPQLREIDRKYPDAVTVIGVHSGKYHAERETPRIRDAAARLENTHPIINDRQFRVWRAYAVNAWPTLVVIDPASKVLGATAGEFTAARLAPLLDRMVATYAEAGLLVRGERHFAPDPPTITPGALRYPGKVAVDGDRIAIADSGHHRVLVGRLDRAEPRVVVERVLGRGTAGFEDGTPGALASPQGLAIDGDTLYVADAENHAIRAADLRTGALRTLAGTGRQLRTREDQREGAMSSPWDLTQVSGMLYIAMAGIHQLWALDLATRAARPHSGSMREDIVDGPHAAAALAQPMGITTDGVRLYFTDPESSAVRWSDVDPAGRVGTIVGTGLFDFGDRDGVGDAALLQHAQGIARHRDGRLLVADSYNDALKWVDPATRAATTWVRDLHEPGGVACAEEYAYVADTNAHRIVRVRYETGLMEEMEVVGGGGV